MEWNELRVFSNHVVEWGVFLVITAVLWRLLTASRAIAARGLRRLKIPGHERLSEDAAVLVERTRALVLLIIAGIAGSFVLDLPPTLTLMRERLLMLTLIVQAGIWLSGALQALLVALFKVEGAAPERSAGLTLLSFVAQLVLWSLVVLLILDNLGVNVTALVAGLGVGGVAVALAVQSILSDLFSSLAIILDKPFEIGDFIIADDLLGTVEKIGIKTTRVRSLGGEQLIFSNSDLLNSRIRNFKRMFERRVVFTIDVVYQTPLEKLKQIPQILREAVEARDLVRFDRAHLKMPSGSAYVYEVVYYVKSPDFNVYMDIQQEIYFEVIERFAVLGITLAYPTQTLFVRKAGTLEGATLARGE